MRPNPRYDAGGSTVTIHIAPGQVRLERLGAI
jgi:hypothetical protein